MAEFRATDTARELAQLYISGATGHPKGNEPQSRKQAYAVQDKLIKHLGGASAWKVGRGKNNPEPYCAPVPAHSVCESGAVYQRRGSTARVEAELGLKIARDVPAASQPIGTGECVCLIDQVVPVIEILETRLAGDAAAHPLWKLADLQANGAVVSGQGLDWAEQDLKNVQLSISVPRQSEIESTPRAHPFGDPFELFCWLVNHAAMHRGGLRKGDLIITGSYCGIIEIDRAGIFEARFEGFSPVTVEIT